MAGNAKRILILMAVLGLASPLTHAEDRAIRSRVNPTYPEIAKRMHITGAVRVEAKVDPSGNVVDAKAISGNRMLGIAAEDAVRRWKFAAGASESTETLEINFSIGGQ